MERSRALLVVAGILLTVLLVAVATAEPVSLTERSPQLPFSLPELDRSDRDAVSVTPTTVVPSEEREPSSELAEWASLLIELSLMFLMLGAVALVVKRVWAGRPAAGRHEVVSGDPFDPLVEVGAAIADDADEQRRILMSGAPRNAIVECWLRVEMLVEASGLDPDPSETSTELTTRVLGRFDVDGAAVDRLAALYREARFSEHDLGESQRSAAVEALDSIHASLRERTDVAP